jgi:anti-sigma factor RsiW
MSGAASCREMRHSLGVYVLGAIDPAERAQVDEHLATCADCREELASLAGLPALLRRVPTAEAERLAVADQADPADPAAAEPSADKMLPSLLARTAQTRRVRRWRELAAAAAVAVLALGAGAAGASVLGSSPSGSPSQAQPAARHTWQTVSAVDSRTGATLTVKYASVPWGTTMAARVSGIPAGTVCQFVITDTHGHRFVVGGWRVNNRGWRVWYPASTSLPDASLGSFQVTAGGKVMASVDAA